MLLSLAGLVVFVVLGVVRTVLAADQVTQTQISLAAPTAEYVALQEIRPHLTSSKLEGAYGRGPVGLDRTVREAVVKGPVVGVSVWLPSGWAVLSSFGKSAPARISIGVLAQAMSGQVSARVARLPGAKGTQGMQVVETYVPVYLTTSHGTLPDAIVAVDTRYGSPLQLLQGVVGGAWIALLFGLALLYLGLLTLSRRTYRDLARRNADLAWQAELLDERVREERRTVAALQEVNRLKEEFVAMTSHELRTPITAIKGYLQTLLRPEFADDEVTRDEFLRASERQVERLHRLVENLLTASRVEDGIRLEATAFAFGEAVGEVLEGLGDQRARVRVMIPANLPPMFSDRTAIQQVASNLLDNALKFSHHDQPCDLGASSDGRTLSFWITDRGIGIPADQRERIFDRFYQVDSSLRRSYGGLGLGLSLVKGVVEGLGGRLEVQSAPGAGSTFTVRVPLQLSSRGLPGPAPAVTAPPSGGYARYAGAPRV